MSKIFCAQIIGTEAVLVSLEVDISPGLYNFKIVGLADKSIEEAKERVSAAIKSSVFESPKNHNRKTIISLAPGELYKKGTHFDASIALSYLIQSKQIPKPRKKFLVLGELSFDGSLKSTSGTTAIISQIKRLDINKIIIPKDSFNPIMNYLNVEIICCGNLKEAIEALYKSKVDETRKDRELIPNQNHDYIYDEIVGNKEAKRALVIALAGGHNISLCGTPGTGKTILARSAAELVPKLSIDEELFSQSIYSLVPLEKEAFKIPFRNPHHHSSSRIILGGGQRFIPGEVSLAHKGILFMDEFPEFNRNVIEGLREVLQDKYIRIQKSDYSVKVPADFILIIAHNPCRCGYYQSGIKECRCSPNNIKQYQQKLSGPIIDRIDISVFIEKVDHKYLLGSNVLKEEDTAKEICQKIIAARQKQLKNRGVLNSCLGKKHLDKLIITKEAKRVLDDSAKKFYLSGRGYYSVLKVAQTIADLDSKETNPSIITKEKVLEALYFRTQYRN